MKQQQPYLFRSCGSDDVSDIVEVENGQPDRSVPVRPPVPSGPPVALTLAVRLALDRAIERGVWDLREQGTQAEVARLVATTLAASSKR